MTKYGFQKKLFILLKNGVFNQHNTPPPNSEVKPGLIRSFSKIETGTRKYFDARLDKKYQP